MNANITRALFSDALAQVLDNKVFRLLVVLVGIMVLPTFLIGLQEDSVVILFGTWEYFYEDLFGWLGLPFPGLGQAHIFLIQAIQQIFVDVFAGSFGVTIAVAASAFFVPRMLEKGAADTLFSKPVSRTTLLLSRYFAGLVFVAILSVVLVSGMHIGLLLNSGYSDPGFLWSILTLVYIFAILHAFSMFVGVITRSTVASILTTLMFFMFTGCTHVAWEAKEGNQAKIEESRALRDDTVEDADAFDRFEQIVIGAVDVAHFVLPKTNDATKIAQKLRSSLDDIAAPVRDIDTGLEVKVPPEGWAVAGDFPEEPVTWSSPDGSVTLLLARRQWDGPEAEGDEHRWGHWARFMTERIAGERRAEIEASVDPDDLVEERTRRGHWKDGDGDFERTRADFADHSSIFLTWTDRSGPEERARQAIFFSRLPEWIYRVEIDHPVGWDDDEENARLLDGFTASFTFEDDDDDDPDDWYAERFDWDAELKYNIFFSIGSTLAFIGLLLALGSWRLSRIDF